MNLVPPTLDELLQQGLDVVQDAVADSSKNQVKLFYCKTICEYTKLYCF